MQTAHPSDDGPVLDVHVPCARCEYDLIRSHVYGKCPECGLEVIATVAQHGDPDVAYLASPELPRLASNAVIAVTVVPLVVMLAQASGPALRTIDALAGRGRSLPSQVERPSWIVCAAILATAAMFLHKGLAEQANPTLRASIGSVRITRLAVGLWSWSAVLAAAFVVSLFEAGKVNSFSMIVLAVQLFPMVFTLITLGPLLGRAGAMSRAYREARHGKQGAEVLSVTLAATCALFVAGPIIARTQSAELTMVAQALSIVLMLLSVLGLAYITANGWVIATALRTPRIDPRRLK
jgi:hypothetical protein